MQLRKVNAFIALIEYLMNRVACVLVCVCVCVGRQDASADQEPGQDGSWLDSTRQRRERGCDFDGRGHPGSMKIVLSANCAVINYVCVCVKSVI